MLHLVFVGAHPDDETFASGTIARHVEDGGKATIVVASRGGKGHWKIPSEELCRIRTGEMEKAAKTLGAEVVWLDYEDASIPTGDSLRESLVDVYRKLKPNIVITFHPLVWRDDHRRVGLAAHDATLKASLPLHKTNYPYHRPEPEVYFFGDTMIPMIPDAFVDVTKFIDIKHETFLQHRSQWESWETDGPVKLDNPKRIWNWFSERFASYGCQCGVKYAEGFINRRGKKLPLNQLLQPNR